VSTVIKLQVPQKVGSIFTICATIRRTVLHGDIGFCWYLNPIESDNYEELHGFYSSPSVVRVIKARRMRWAGHVALMGEVRGAYNILVGRPEGRRPLGRPRHGWEDNIKMDLREIGFGDVDWIDLAQDRDRWRALLNTVMNLWVP
jgi:hypothetical protein